MKARTGSILVLVALQILGAATSLAYPVIVMGLLLGEQGGKTQLLVASLVWPLLVGLLWTLSWLAVRRGRTLLALALSAPPALVFAFGVYWFAVGSHRAKQSVKQMNSEEAEEIESARKQNPLAGEILALEAGQTDWPGLQDAIARANPDSLSRPVDLPPRGLLDARRSTPLALALQASRLGLSLDSSKTTPHSLEAARLLIGRGARLSPEEESTAGSTAGSDLPWMVEVVGRGTELPDRTAASENPLVWRIMTAHYADPVNADISAAKRSHPELLSRATTTYGTPLHAAILRGSLCQACEFILVTYGAQLSESERKVPRLVARVEAIRVSSRP